MRSRCTVLLLLLGISLPAAAADFAGEVPAAAGDALRIELDRGSVTVRSHEGSLVRVTARTRGMGASSVRFELSEVESGAVLRCHSDAWLDFLRGGPTVEVEAYLPHEVAIDVRTEGGDVHIAAVDAGVVVRTSTGAVRVEDVEGSVDVQTSGAPIATRSVRGDVSAVTAGGRIDVYDVQGDVRAVTSGGSISLTRVEGDAETLTSGGPIEIDGLSGEVRARTSGGAIRTRFTDEPAGVVETSGGGIEVAFPARVGATLDALTYGGRVEVDAPVEPTAAEGGRLLAQLNGGGPRLLLRASGGSIRVRRQ